MKQGSSHITELPLLALLAVLVLIFASSCVWDKGELPTPVSPGSCDTSTYTYTNNIAVIFNTNCAIGACHVGGSPIAGLDFSSYDVISDKIGDNRIQARTLNGSPTFMPPTGKLPDSTLAKISQWINEGACQ